MKYFRTALITIVGIGLLVFVLWNRAASMPPTTSSATDSRPITWRDTGVPCLTISDDKLAEHIHPHLTLLVNGASTTIPAEIGIDQFCTAEIHTHDASGQIHIEAMAERAYTLADFFKVWGQPLDRAGYTHTITAAGKPIDAATYVMKDDEELVVAYTNAATSTATTTSQ